LAAHVERLAKPILGIAGQRVARVAFEEILEGGLRGSVIALQQVAIRRLIKLLGLRLLLGRAAERGG
jgi:hypothetical protein